MQGLARHALAVELEDEARRAKSRQDAARYLAEAEALAEEACTKYADVMLHGSPLAVEAAQLLYSIRNLSIGKRAPEIDAPGADGQPLRLSRFRGKVTVLYFWGDW